MKEVVRIPGSQQDKFVVSGGIAYEMSDSGVIKTIRQLVDIYFYRSPDGRWLFAARNFRGPAIDVYDLVQGSVIRHLMPTGSTGASSGSGTGAGDRFYFYISKGDGGSARLWTVFPTTTELGEGVAIEPFAQIPSCSRPSFAEERITAVGNNLFVYEEYGSKSDRRTVYSDLVPGGAWRVDSVTGRLLQHVTPDLHFSALVPDRTGAVLYGLSSGGPNWASPVKLVSIDAQDGHVLQSRDLDAGYWTISVVPLRMALSGDVRAIQDR